MKNYVEELSSASVRGLLQRTLPVTSRWTAVEVTSAITRCCREGDFEASLRDQLLERFHHDLRELYVVELVSEVFVRARSLLLQHPLRAADAIQLASCLVLRDKVGRPVTFAAFDQRLLDAAQQHGLDLFGI